MKIYLITVCRNEEEILPHFFKYYDNIVDRYFVYYNIASIDRTADIIDLNEKATRIDIDTKGELRDDLNSLIKNSVWKEWSEVATWVIAVDSDEFLYHEDGLREYLKSCLIAGISIPLTKGYDIVSNEFFNRNYSGRIPIEEFKGSRNVRFDKSAVFNCQEVEEIYYSAGAHSIRPNGNIVYDEERTLYLLHFKYLGSLDRLKKRWNAMGSYLSELNISMGWGIERKDPREIIRRYNNSVRDSISIVEEEASLLSVESIRITTIQYRGIIVKFAIIHEEDHIQGIHLNGEWYELEELELMSKYISLNAKVLDVGANVGNHILYFALVLESEHIVYVEPNPEVYKVLDYNLLLNRVYEKTLLEGHRGYALSNKKYRGQMSYHTENLGGGEVYSEEEGSVEVITGDELFSKEIFDFIKIDTENLDIECLLGLKQVIINSSCPVFVEIQDTRRVEFDQFVDDISYQISDSYKRYPLKTNYIITPLSYS